MPEFHYAAGKQGDGSGVRFRGHRVSAVKIQRHLASQLGGRQTPDSPDGLSAGHGKTPDFRMMVFIAVSAVIAGGAVPPVRTERIGGITLFHLPPAVPVLPGMKPDGQVRIDLQGPGIGKALLQPLPEKGKTCIAVSGQDPVFSGKITGTQSPFRGRKIPVGFMQEPAARKTVGNPAPGSGIPGPAVCPVSKGMRGDGRTARGLQHGAADTELTENLIGIRQFRQTGMAHSVGAGRTAPGKQFSQKNFRRDPFRRNQFEIIQIKCPAESVATHQAVHPEMGGIVVVPAAGKRQFFPVRQRRGGNPASDGGRPVGIGQLHNLVITAQSKRIFTRKQEIRFCLLRLFFRRNHSRCLLVCLIREPHSI